MDHVHHHFDPRICIQKNEIVMRRIAFFDFDGTITTHDTLLAFIRFNAGTVGFYFGFLLNSPWLLAYRIKVISNQQAKERILRYFFGKMPVADFDERCKQFCSTILPGLIRKKAMHEISLHQAANTEVVIVSASPENWVKLWCEYHGVGCIATKLQVKNERITGRILEKNCHGIEKVSRIKALYSLGDYNEICCYGDTNGDKPLLKLATIAFYQPFR